MGNPSLQWRDRDKALLEVQSGIRKAVLDLNETLHPITEADISNSPTPDEEQSDKPTVSPPIHVFHVPHDRNPFFTGREDILARIQEALQDTSKGSKIPVALSGLGGVGKTQITIEYAYRHHD